MGSYRILRMGWASKRSIDRHRRDSLEIQFSDTFNICIICLSPSLPLLGSVLALPSGRETGGLGGHRCKLGWGLHTGHSFMEGLLREGNAKP